MFCHEKLSLWIEFTGIAIWCIIIYINLQPNYLVLCFLYFDFNLDFFAFPSPVFLIFTHKVSKRGKNKDASKPVKQKRRQSLGKGEKTPTGPTPKRSRTGKAKALNTDTTTDKENIGTEGDMNISPSSNKFTKMVEGGKPKVAICKDLTSRGGCHDMEWF